MTNVTECTNRDEIKGRVRAIIREQLESDEIAYDEENLDCLNELGIDSLSFVDLIFRIESEFAVTAVGGFSDEQLVELATTDDLADLIIATKAAG